MSIFSDIISRMSLESIDDIKSTIQFISNWLYELNHSSTKKEQKYINLGNAEYKDLYNILAYKVYKTNFSFTTYETNKKLVLIYFIKYIYEISTPCAKIIYNSYKKDSCSNEYMTDIINNDKILYQK
jgi:hypothetical protein